MPRRSNPEHTGNLLLLVGVGVAGYLAYVNGWFSSLFGGVTAAAQPLTVTTTGTGTTTAPAASVTAPPLGTTVSSAAQVAAQVAANYPYILPNATTFGAYTSSAPSGYAAFYLTDAGNVLLRQDVASAANQQVSSSGVSMSLSDLKTLMQSKGLSGLGFMRGRSLFPTNPILDGAQIVNTGRHYVN